MKKVAVAPVAAAALIMVLWLKREYSPVMPVVVVEILANYQMEGEKTLVVSSSCNNVLNFCNVGLNEFRCLDTKGDGVLGNLIFVI